MNETDLGLGGGYTYQWECAILLALNYFFEPVRYNPALFDLIDDFLDQVAEIHLEGEKREDGIELEDINLFNAGRARCVLIQVKTKQAEGERWTPGDPLLLKALYRFYANDALDERPEDVRFVFLTNRPFNPTLVGVKAAIREGALEQSEEADTLRRRLGTYARREKKGPVSPERFRQMLERTALVEYLDVDAVKANVQRCLREYGRSDWEQAYAVLFEHFSRQSTLKGGGTVTRDSIIGLLWPLLGVRLQNLRDFTVQIHHGTKGGIAGTGIAVSPDGKVVTCAHVVGTAGVNPRHADGAEVGVYFPQARGGEKKARRATVAACFPQYDDDVVLLQLTDGPAPLAPEQIAVLGRADSSQGNPFRSYGYRRLESYIAGWADGKI
jgi:hypothetical protein